MDETIARLNIEHFHKRPADETDEPTRLTLLKLLSEEEAKLALISNQAKKKTC